jgi:hypothetical protein
MSPNQIIQGFDIFTHLPSDILSDIYSIWDDTYTNIFKSHNYKIELSDAYWKRKDIQQAVIEMVYTELEWRMQEGFLFCNNLITLDDGRHTNPDHFNLRQDTYVHLSVFHNVLRWVILPANFSINDFDILQKKQPFKYKFDGMFARESWDTWIRRDSWPKANVSTRNKLAEIENLFIRGNTWDGNQEIEHITFGFYMIL